jgi:uncharacterized protein (TIGR04222 family)
MTGTRTLDVYEMAYLAGGPRQAVEAAVVSLIEIGVLRATRPTGELMLIKRRPCVALEGRRTRRGRDPRSPTDRHGVLAVARRCAPHLDRTAPQGRRAARSGPLSRVDAAEVLAGAVAHQRGTTDSAAAPS